MADYISCCEENHIFCDVGGVIGDSFEVFGNGEEIEEGREIVGLVGVFGDDGFYYLGVEGVDDFLLGEDLFGAVVLIMAGVAIDGSAQGTPDYWDHLLDYVHSGELVVVAEVAGAFGNVYGAIGDAFEVAVDFEHGAEESQVRADGLVEGHEADCFGFDFDFLGVDLLVAFDYSLSQAVVLADHGVAGFGEHILDLAGHTQGAS